MKFYQGNENDPVFAVYEKDGVCYPVFEEKYGSEGIPFDESMKEITDAQSVEALEKYLNPYEEGKTKVYMAGPLFNEGDRFTNQNNSDILRAKGYTTFLPQEIVITDQSTELVKAGCFYMDLRAIKESDIMLCNCNGIEIDSGTAAEIGMGYTLGKKLVLYKSDVRHYFNEKYVLNNFVGGLVDNKVCKTVDEVLEEIKEFSENR